ncbi:lasso peptide biosynthesis B2 protein [Thermogemmatispora sp.]|uniref:lasso peptide biosynthesis B2 protein n=1 Tax=Thermogemmatispora sp. TaxID=1968838 RepID=UPI0035E46231
MAPDLADQLAVFASHTTEGGVLLDLRRGRYLGLTPRGWQLWEALQAGAGDQELVAVLRRQGMTEEAARAEVRRFLQRVASHGLIEAEPSRSWRRARSRLLWVLRFGALLGDPLDAWLTLWGIRRTLCRADGLLLVVAEGQALPGAASDQLTGAARPRISRLCRWMRWASLMQRRPPTCLEQSLALWWVLRKRGIAAHVVLGISTAPFTAHAWVEGPDGPLFWKAGLGWLAHRAMLGALQPIFHSGRDQL